MGLTQIFLSERKLSYISRVVMYLREGKDIYYIIALPSYT